MQKKDRPLLVALAVIGACLVVVFLLQPHPEWLDGTLLYNIPEGVGALAGGTLAAIAGFFILRAARIQATATVRAARDQSEAAMEVAREHNRAAFEVQNRQSRAQANQQRLDILHRRAVLIAALQGELTAARKRILGQITSLEALRDEYDKHPPSVPPFETTDIFPRIETPMYAAHASEIGLLPVELIRQLSEVHGNLAGLRTFPIESMKGIPAIRAVKMAIDFLKQFVPELDAVIRDLESEAQK